jgi:hypothetical protein
MCKIIKKIIFIVIIALALFIGITIWGGGGDKFRWLGEKTGVIIQKGADRLGKKADVFKKKIDSAEEKARKWMRTGEEKNK